MPSTYILETDSITLVLGGRSILHDVYISLETGKVSGLCGRNGSGKSCLLKIIFGTMKGEYQSVRINGAYVRKAYMEKNMITCLPQDIHIPGYVTCREAFRLYKTPDNAIEKIRATCDIAMEARMDTLSSGTRRLMEVLIVIHSPSRFLLLDEPFSFLAPVMVDLVREHIDQVRSEKAILITDHQYNTVLDVADELYLCREGVIRLLGDPSELYQAGYLPS